MALNIFKKIISVDNNNQNHVTSHRLILQVLDKEVGLSGYIAFHRGGFINPTFGATRIWPYKSQTDALKDVLKLSETMSYKSAMAGFKYGGAKAVLIDQTNSHLRIDFLKAYTKYINLLNGHFITGADVGVDRHDLKILRENSKYIVGLKSDPVKYTVLGVLFGIEECLKFIFGSSDLNKRSFAIQGLGKTGMGLLNLIYQQTDQILISDVNPKVLKIASSKFPKTKIVNTRDICKHKVDVLVPCALSSAINFKNISGLKCKIIAGCANNQLESNTIGDILHKIGILYAPDYVINAGGLIAVVNEYENGRTSDKIMRKKLQVIRKNLVEIFNKSKKQNQPTYLIANKLAEEKFVNFK